MSPALVIVGNIIAPAVAGLLFLIFFLYFVLTGKTRTPDYVYFAVYLLSFALFLLGRPLQLLLGSGNTSLIINNIRVLLFSLVTFPCILSLNTHKAGRPMYFIIGAVIGISHVVLNTLGTQGSYLVLDWNGITLHDNYTPSFMPPYYAREYTIATFILLGAIITAVVIVRMIREARSTGHLRILSSRFAAYNLSIMVFGLSFVAGAATKQWWFYYIVSVLSALILTLGVLLEMKDMHVRLNQVVPLLKEYVLQNIPFSRGMEAEILRMLNIIGISESLNSCLVIRLFPGDMSAEKQKTVGMSVLEQYLVHNLGRGRFVLMPMSGDLIGLCYLMKDGDDRRMQLDLADSLEDIIRKKLSINVNIGLGRRYDGLAELKFSYKEALAALTHADEIGVNQLLHIDDLRDSGEAKHLGSFLVPEREELLQAVRLGDGDAALKVLDQYIGKVSDIADVNSLKVRTWKLIGLMTEAAIAAGAEERALLDRSVEFYRRIGDMANVAFIGKILKAILEEMLELISSSATKRIHPAVHKAKGLIDGNLHRALSVREAADAVNLSPSYFQHVFKTETGQSFVEYVTGLKVLRAREALRQTDAPISEIAYSLGFEDSNYFSKVFRQKTGLSPRSYRNAETLSIPEAEEPS